jgi:hypothetical protein
LAIEYDEQTGLPKGTVPVFPDKRSNNNSLTKGGAMSGFVDTQSGFYRDYTQPNPSVPLSRVDETEAGVANFMDRNVVGEKANPIIRKIANPVLSTVEAIDNALVQPIFKSVATITLANYLSQQRGYTKLPANFRLAKELAWDSDYGTRVTTGQTLATQFGGNALNMATLGLAGTLQGLAKDIGINAGQESIKKAGEVFNQNNLPLFMRPSFDITDAKQREQAFEEETAGIITSAVLDVGTAFVAGFGVGAAVRGAKTLAVGSRVVKNPQEVTRLSDQTVDWVNSGKATPAPTAFAQLADDLVQSTTYAQARNNPFSINSPNPDRFATLASKADNIEDVVDLIKVDRGVPGAIESLLARRPALADPLIDFGVNLTKPISSFSDINKIPSKAWSAHLNSVVKDISKTDPQLAKMLDSFAVDALHGGGTTRYMPGRSLRYERFTAYKNKLAWGLRYGTLSGLGAGWKVTEYGASKYQRGIRFFQWWNDESPKGHIYLGSRVDESNKQLIAEMNNARFLREDVDFKEQAVRRFNEAVDDTQRAQAVAETEYRMLLKFAEKYDIGGLSTLQGKSRATQVGYLQRFYDDITNRRSGAIDFVKNNGWIDDLDGNLNFIKAPGMRKDGLTTRSVEPEFVPFIDFARLEAGFIKHLRNAKKTEQFAKKVDIKDEFWASARPISTTMQGFFDFGNMLFSNLALLRIAYIPKNSIIDPYVRATTFNERPFGLSPVEMGQTAKNTYYNQVTRRGQLWRTRFDSKQIRKDLKQQEKSITSDRATLIRQEREATGELARARKASRKLDPNSPEGLANNQKIYELRVFLNDLKPAIANADESFRLIKTKLTDLDSRITTIKMGKKDTGTNPYVYKSPDGQDINIAGPADPQAKGASVFRVEADAAESFLSPQRTSQIAQRARMKAESPRKISVSEGDSYWDAMTRMINRSIRQEREEVAGMLIRGDSNTQIINWLRSPSGSFYLTRMKSMLDRNGDQMLTRSDLDDWLNTQRQIIFERLPSPELRELLMTRPVKASEVKGYLTPYINDLPEIDGVGVNRVGIFNKHSEGMSPVELLTYYPDQMFQYGWKGLAWAENKFVRYPMFDRYWVDEMDMLVKQAESSGKTITYDMLNGPMRQLAYKRALQRVESQLYTARSLTNGGVALRYMLAFPAAFFNSQIVGAKLLYKNPFNAYYYTKVNEALDGWAPYEDDDGNTYQNLKEVPNDGRNIKVSLPIPDSLQSRLKNSPLRSYFQGEFGGLKVPQRQMEFMLGDAGISWFFNANLSELVKMGEINTPVGKIDGTQIERAMRNALGDKMFEEQIFFGGNPAVGRNYLETVGLATVPTYAKMLVAGGIPGDPGERVVEEANRLIMVDVKNHIASAPNDSFDFRAEDYVKAGRQTLLYRALASFISPGQITWDSANREAMSMWVKHRDKYEPMYGAEKAAEMATNKLVGLYGIEHLALLGSGTKRTLGQPATLEAYSVLRKHGKKNGLIEQVIAAGGNETDVARMLFFDADDIQDEWQPVVNAIQKRMNVPGQTTKLMTEKTPEEGFRDSMIRMGRFEMERLNLWRDAAMYELGITSTQDPRYLSSNLGLQYQLAKQTIETRYPPYAARPLTIQEFEKRVADPLRVIVNDPKWLKDNQNTEVWNELQIFLADSDEALKRYKFTNVKEERDRVRAIFNNNYFVQLQSNSTEYRLFAAKFLTNHPLLSEDIQEASR